MSYRGAALWLVLYVAISAAWIHLPGPQQDELLHLPVLSPVLRPGALDSLHLGGRTIPLMIMSYVGALKGWLLWLWFRVVPEGVVGHRAFGILLGAVTLWMTFWFVSRYWSRAVALLSLALISTDPSFVHSIRLDYGPVALMHFLKMAGLCLLSRWVATNSRILLASAMFLFGLGLWDKANFIWFLAGLAATVLLLFPRQVAFRIRRNPSIVPLAAVFLLLGAAPLISYNLRHSGQTWRERGRLEIRWSKLLQAQGTFQGNFMSALAGEGALDSSPAAHDVMFPRLADWTYQFGRRRDTIILPLLWLSLLILPLNLWIGTPRLLLFPLLLSILVYACMFLSFDGGSSVHHVVMVQPFPLLFLAVSLWTPAECWRAFLPRAAAVAIVATAVAVNLMVNARHLAIYTRTGGTGPFTDAVYRLVPYLAQQPQQKLFALDWGFSRPVIFLGSRWDLNVDDMFFSLNAPGSPDHQREVDRLAELMGDPANLFLLHSPQRTLFPAPAQAFYALASTKVAMRQVATFHERSGERVYDLYQRDGGATMTQLPQEVEVQFVPERVSRNQQYLVQVKGYANTWIDLVYHVDQQSSRTATRFCLLDGQGRARIVVPASHPLATVTVTMIRPEGGEWRRAKGSITVVK